MKMRDVRLRRPSPALVIACAALAVALAPASYAAVSQLCQRARSVRCS
jgi:hypothetical protein